jgi:hypothetical protein
MTGTRRNFAHAIATYTISYGFFGPLKESNGKRLILVIIDAAIMWPELIATDNLESRTVCDALYDNAISRFGLPRSLAVVSDNGSAFTSTLAATFARTYGIKQYLTIPYHKQANSRAEQFGQTIHQSLGVLCSKQADWSKHLQSVTMYYRYAQHLTQLLVRSRQLSADL